MRSSILLALQHLDADIEAGMIKGNSASAVHSIFTEFQEQEHEIAHLEQELEQVKSKALEWGKERDKLKVTAMQLRVFRDLLLVGIGILLYIIFIYCFQRYQ